MKRIQGITVIILVLLPLLAYPQNPTKWRGPNRNGYYNETGLLKEWPAGGPEILWQYDKLGEGYSSPAFGNGRIYISGMEDQTGYVYALEQDGRLIWKTPYGKEWLKSYPGSRGTPVIDEDRLFILSGMGRLSCFSANSGQLLWTKDLFTEFGGRNSEWGLAETVVIYGEKLICTPGGRIHNIIALNKMNGELIWTSKGMGEISAYCTPLLVKIDDRNLLITHTAKNIIGVDADDGEFLWNYPHVNIYDIHPNTPLYHDGQVFCFSGYGKGGVMLRLNEDGSKVTKMWFCETMDSRIGGAVYMDGYLYGSGDKSREWQCIDWSSGRMRYDSKEIGNGVVIAAEGLLYIYSQRGELALVKPGPSSFEIISETRISTGSGQHWAHPVIDNGRLFIRHGNALIAYKIK
jgi:outer membrane protein assembly factor BamB